MWPKEDYQEHMLGYLEGLRIEFEQLIHSPVQQYDLDEFYANLDLTSEWLWQLIGASEVYWEAYRNPLEASCDELLRAIRQRPDDTSVDISFDPMNSFMLLGVRVVQLEPEPVSSNVT